MTTEERVTWEAHPSETAAAWEEEPMQGELDELEEAVK
jgi:hypothetical protein